MWRDLLSIKQFASTVSNDTQSAVMYRDAQKAQKGGCYYSASVLPIHSLPQLPP